MNYKKHEYIVEQPDFLTSRFTNLGAAKCVFCDAKGDATLSRDDGTSSVIIASKSTPRTRNVHDIVIIDDPITQQDYLSMRASSINNRANICSFSPSHPDALKLYNENENLLELKTIAALVICAISFAIFGILLAYSI